MYVETEADINKHADDVGVSTSSPQLSQRPRIARQVFGALIVIASIFPLLLAVLSYLGRYNHLAELICNFRLQIVFMLLSACLAVWVFGYRRWAGLLLCTSVIIGVGIARGLLPGPNPPEGPKSVKLMSFNVFEGNENYPAGIDCIRTEDPDIFIIIEYDSDWSRELQTFDATYPYRILEPRWHGFGIAIFSKLPLSGTQVYPLTEKVMDNPFVVTQINIGDQRLRLAAAHLLAPMDRTRMEIRNNQFAEIANILQGSVQPTILAGDFNCVPWSPFMKDMLKTANLRDSRVGFGYQASWPTNWIPMRIPIDQALVSDSIHVSDRHLQGPTGSDHFPLVLEFSISD